MIITNNTLVANYDGNVEDAGTIRITEGSAIISNNIIAFNSTGILKKSGAGTVTLQYNCVIGLRFLICSGYCELVTKKVEMLSL